MVRECEFVLSLMEFSKANSQNAAPNGAKVLLADTTRWAGATRLALALSKAGFEVAVVCPDHHPILKTRTRFQTFHYSALRPEKSLSLAIAATKPHMVIPCDERAAHHLRGLYSGRSANGDTNNGLDSLIERSLGDFRNHAILSARNEFLHVARQEGLRVPDTETVDTVDDLSPWAKSHPFPWVLKADGTWGGGGVKIVHTLEQAERAFVELRNTYNLYRVAMKLCLDRDWFWLRPWASGTRPAVTVQSYIEGRPANCGFACWQGKVLACIAVEAVSTLGETGPASVVRILDNREMEAVAEKVARRLGLSGFVGLDFVVDNLSGEAFLIEINPRCTPVSHLQLGPGKDLIEALRSQLCATPLREFPAETNRAMIAYFPQAWHCESSLLTESFQDIPRDEPELVKELLEPWVSRSLVFRASKGLSRLKAIFRSQATESSSSEENGMDLAIRPGGSAASKIPSANSVTKV
jgi:hypothetical protein